MNRSASNDNRHPVDVLAEEFNQRLRQGENPTIDEYVSKHPEFADEIRRVFPALLALGRAKIDDLDSNATIAHGVELPATHAHIRYIGDYEILEEIARGGMGIVYKARQTSLKRLVAIKMILAGDLASDNDAKRFKAEAEAAAQLDHPGIVPIYEVGVHEGIQYFSMAFVEGISLADKIQKHAIAPQTAAELTKQIALAVQYAHDRGVIHRDLKPKNILLDQNGQTRVTDFGLAKQIATESDLTVTGQLLGTPAYMSPEQAIAESEQVDRRADVYSIGVILFELLTGELPFRGTIQMIIKQIVEQNAPSPRNFDANIPKDLETICLKCMEKNPADRFQSCAELVDELDRFLTNRPIHSRPIGRLVRTARWCKRHPLPTALFAVVLMTAIVALYFSVVAFRSNLVAEMATAAANAERRMAAGQSQKAQRAEVAAVAARKLSEATLSQSNYYFFRAVARWNENRLTEADEFLQKIPEEQRRFEWHLTARQLMASDITIRTENARFRQLSFNPLGNQLLVAGNALYTVDLKTGKASQVFSGRRLVVHSHDGTKLLTREASGQGRILLCDARSGEQLITFDQPGATCAAFDPKGHQVVIGSGPDSMIAVWDSESGKHLKTLQKVEIADSSSLGPELSSVCFGENGRIIVSGHERKIVFWDVESGKEIRQFTGGRLYRGDKVVINHDTTNVCAPSLGNRGATVWNVKTGKTLQTLTPDSDPYTSTWCCAFSPVGNIIATGDSDNLVKLWDTRTGRLLRTLKGHLSSVYDVAFSPDGKSLASVTTDTIKIWDLRRQDWVKAFDARVRAAAFSPDGKELVTCDHSSITFWNTATGTKGKTIDLQVDRLTGIAVHPQNELVTVCSQLGKIAIIDQRREQPVRFFEATHELADIAFVSDGSRIAAVNRYGKFTVWETKSGKELFSNRSEFGSRADSRSIAVSPRGDFVALNKDASVEIWDMRSFELIRTVTARMNSVYDLDFSPDGLRLVAGASNGSMKIWDLSTLKNGIQRFDLNYQELIGHTGIVHTVSFNADGTRIASASADRTVRIWDAITLEELCVLEKHDFREPFAKFSPTEDLLITQNIGRSELLFWKPSNSDQVWNDAYLEFKSQPDPDWHRSEARRAEANADWYGALFHWSWVLEAEADSDWADYRLRLSHEQFVQNSRSVVLHPRIVRWLEASPKLLTSEAPSMPSRIAKLINSNVWRKTWDNSLSTNDLAAMSAVCNRFHRISYLNTLGVAQYHTGEFGKAAKTLAKAIEVGSGSDNQPHPLDFAFLALSQHRMDLQKEALENLRRFKKRDAELINGYERKDETTAILKSVFGADAAPAPYADEQSDDAPGRSNP